MAWIWTDRKTGEIKSFTLKYISWTDSWDRLFTLHPRAMVKIHEWDLCDHAGHWHPEVKVPYVATPHGVLIGVSVTIPETLQVLPNHWEVHWAMNFSPTSYPSFRI